MGDMNFSKAFARLKVEHEYLCDRKIQDVNRWGCKGCEYYYEHSGYIVSRCLKSEIKDWMLYQINNSEK